MRFPIGANYEDYKKKWYNAQKYGAGTTYGYHEGDDFNLTSGGDSDLGKPLFACADGEVSSVHSHTTIPTFGNHIHIFHPTLGVWSHYAHCGSLSVKPGEQVHEGQQIGTLGKSGTTAAHLHFAIKNQPTGLDAIAKTKGDLAKWENPTAFIEARLTNSQPSMPETIQLDKKTFEELVSKSTSYDAIRTAGVTSASDVEALKNAIKQAQDERGTAQTEARKTRDELIEFKQQVAEKLLSPQDLPRILAAIEEVLKERDALHKQLKTETSENETYEAQIVELKAEITRLQLLLKGENPLSEVTLNELLQELLRRFSSILGKN